MRTLFILFTFFSTGSQLFEQDFTTQKKITQDVIQYFEGNQVSEIFALFDDKMKSAITEEKLSEIWNSLPFKCGNYLGSGDSIASEVQGMVVVNQFLDFEKMDLDIRLTFNNENQISGLYFVEPVKKK